MRLWVIWMRPLPNHPSAQYGVFTHGSWPFANALSSLAMTVASEGSRSRCDDMTVSLIGCISPPVSRWICARLLPTHSTRAAG